MPRKKKYVPAKRSEILDEDGWTRITNSRQQQRPMPVQSTNLVTPADLRTSPEPGSDLSTIRKAFEKCQATWQASESCTSLQTILTSKVLRNDVQIDRCLIFGSGSFCGLSRGWISRHAVALQQLAVLCSLRNAIAQQTTAPACFAQEPAYNDLDIGFLKTLAIEVVDTPGGYDLITEKSLVFTPYNEFSVEMEIISRKPAMLITGKLDWLWRNEKGSACTNRQVGADDSSRDLEQDCQLLEAFLQGREQARLPSLDVKDLPFSDQFVYWIKTRTD